jgi:hypothetical protein
MPDACATSAVVGVEEGNASGDRFCSIPPARTNMKTATKAASGSKLRSVSASR